MHHSFSVNLQEIRCTPSTRREMIFPWLLEQTDSHSFSQGMHAAQSHCWISCDQCILIAAKEEACWVEKLTVSIDGEWIGRDILSSVFIHLFSTSCDNILLHCIWLGLFRCSRNNHQLITRLQSSASVNRGKERFLDEHTLSFTMDSRWLFVSFCRNLTVQRSDSGDSFQEDKNTGGIRVDRAGDQGLLFGRLRLTNALCSLAGWNHLRQERENGLEKTSCQRSRQDGLFAKRRMMWSQF